MDAAQSNPGPAPAHPPGATGSPAHGLGSPAHGLGSPAPGFGSPARGLGSPVRRLLVPLGTLAAVGSAFAYVGLVDPNHPGHYPVCPLFALTGVYCPGCGGLRSAHDFITGHLAAALGANALAVAGYLLFAVGWAVWAVRTARGLPLRISLSDRQWWIIGSVVLIFSVVRNLPFGSALAP
ncbi:DUF2752 domain-containing protein [Streptomyces sp. NBC_00083]|uniref:DUF2752 domain-containing protein n=1 Tax=Streptomyces sp. NBC_00083 TaxID=2975647 RepID=UPI0022594A3D|nr:DUF2752 domain-containing protein [Streptomyces sp. NBC_00083]MCX5383014.1 DUF2752 domain-containing protein [Streptomyces sp. NBC_00083]